MSPTNKTKILQITQSCDAKKKAFRKATEMVSSFRQNPNKKQQRRPLLIKKAIALYKEKL
jgi:hypothetical protein